MFSMGAAMILWLDFNEFGSKKGGAHWTSWLWVRILALLVALAFTFTIGYSRLFLGVHTWNQTVFGWQLGLWLALTVHFCFKTTIFYLLKRLERGKVKRALGYVLWGLTIFVFVTAIETANYIIVEPRVADDPSLDSWSVTILQKCPKANMDEAYAKLSEIQNGMVGVGFGAYFGLLFFGMRNSKKMF